MDLATATAEAAEKHSIEPEAVVAEVSATPARAEVSKFAGAVGSFREAEAAEVQAKLQATKVQEAAKAAAKFHSMVRWGKSTEEVATYMEENPGAEHSKDPQNGNYPIHIAVQNGHHMLTKQLFARGVDLNTQNGSGHTALHMARGYDLYWVSRFLLENGAAPDIKNNDGHAAETGMGGDKRPDDALAALSDASSTEELLEAMKLLKIQEGIDKAVLVQTGMSKKKTAKAIWSADVAAGFMEIVKSL